MNRYPFITDEEFRSLLYYQGAIQNINLKMRDTELTNFYSIGNAYETINVLLFPGIENEKSRLAIERRYMDERILEDMDELLNVYCWLYSAMCKYTLHTSKGNTIHTRRDDRRHTYECMKYGINDSFLSTSLRLDSNQYFQKKDGLVLMEFEAEDTVEHINVNDVLGDKSGFPQEDEILYPPFIYLETKPLTLEESEKSFQDCHKAPPCGKYFITLKSSSIEPKERSKETTEWLDQKRKELTAKTEIENAKKVWNAITINAECAYKAEIQQYVNWKQGLKEYLKTIYAIIKYEQR
ncbi:hypothetical protein [Dorea amylophila]|uniref:hypothetical protein n=1 Tax=Dorea amylophila TaxID=2981789 RepID=UPI0022DE9C4B|nr:hypothetical protein [Dorea amylophila]